MIAVFNYLTGTGVLSLTKLDTRFPHDMPITEDDFKVIKKSRDFPKWKKGIVAGEEVCMSDPNRKSGPIDTILLLGDQRRSAAAAKENVEA